MTEPTVIDGDVNDPTGALAHARGCIDFVQQLIGQADVCAANLEGLGVGAQAVGEIRGLGEDAAAFLTAAEQACTEFERHAATQADLAANTDLAGTTAGTYLDGARA